LRAELVALERGLRRQWPGRTPGIKRPGLALPVAGMERRGRIQRRRSRADGRCRVLRLAPEGKALLAGADHTHARHEARLRRLPGRAATRLCQALERIRAGPGRR
jgi:DNA-binding MarR family transcriptional regulator